MTVRELIEALSKMPPDAKVTTEGCDCDGEVAEVESRPDLVPTKCERKDGSTYEIGGPDVYLRRST